MPDETMRAGLPARPMVRGNDGRDYKQVWFKWTDVQAFATAAVLADRASRASAAPGGEPVGEMVGHHKVGFGEMPTIRWRDGYWPTVGTKLYAAPPSDAGQRALLERAANSLQEVTQILDMVLGVSGGYPEDADGPAVEARATIAALRAAISESEGSSNA